MITRAEEQYIVPASAKAAGLHAAFAEYAAKKWGQSEWAAFGRETGTVDVLTAHPRLYRSLSWGDPDYEDAVWDVTPTVLAAASDSLVDQLQLASEFMPDLPAWVAEHASPRTQRRFDEFLNTRSTMIPDVWEENPRYVDEGLPTMRSVSPAKIAVPDELSVSDLARSANNEGPVTKEQQSEKSKVDVRGAEDGKEPSIFIVHGRNVDAVREVQVFVQQTTGLLPESLADTPGRGSTIIEKFERRANDATFAIVLLTPDDEGRAKGDAALQDRARQNVVLELGYFIAKLGRENVAVLNGGVERPSDIDGVSYIKFPGSNWKWELASELNAAGYAKR